MLGLPTVAGIISRMVALVIAFSIHEFAHAWTAYRLGDPTAKHMGRLTLNPRAHLDVLGTIMVLIAGFGWAKPVPVNPRNLRHGPVAGMAMVAAAGPLSNLGLAVISVVHSVPDQLRHESRAGHRMAYQVAFSE